MTEIMPVPRNLILLSYRQRAFLLRFFRFSLGFDYWTATVRWKVSIHSPLAVVM